MPSGYTCYIENDPDFTFEQFAWLCVRNFGVAISMREESMGVKIPERVEVDPFYEKRADEAEKDLDRVVNMTVEEATLWAEQSYERDLKRQEERRAKYEAMKDRYAPFLAAARAFDPPTPKHERYKEFMIEQLEASLEQNKPFGSPPELQDGRTWLKQQIEWAERRMTTAQDEWVRHQDNIKNINEWLASLRDVIPQPEKVLNK